MPQRAFRFLHAADLHIDQPVAGLAEAPEHLLDLLIDCPAQAAVRVFDAAIDQRVDFVVLAGNVINPRACAPRELLLLVEQFERLAVRNIPVYWAGGPDDLLDAWPRHLAWPANVRIFASGRVERLQHEIAGETVCEIVARGYHADESGAPDDFAPSKSADSFTLAIVNSDWSSGALAEAGVDYWALGGRHDWATPMDLAHCVAHYPGSPQGRRPNETGAHGCTLVAVDEFGRIRLSSLSCDVLRWHAPALSLSETAQRRDLEQLIRQRTAQLVEESAGIPAFISWTIACQGPLLTELRRGALATELCAQARSEFGHRTPPAWTIDISAELPAQLPATWSAEESLRGDYLRGVQAHASGESDRDLIPELFSADDFPPGVADRLDAIAKPLAARDAQQRLLREVAWLGADLLSPQENAP